jgi:hypothetical protein
MAFCQQQEQTAARYADVDPLPAEAGQRAAVDGILQNLFNRVTGMKRVLKVSSGVAWLIPSMPIRRLFMSPPLAGMASENHLQRVAKPGTRRLSHAGQPSHL